MNNLYNKYLSGTATADEREALLRHLRDDEQLGGWLRADIEFTEGEMPEYIRERVLSSIYAPSYSYRQTSGCNYKRWMSAAAVMVILVLSLALCWLVVSEQQSAVSPQSAGDLVISTGMGEHSHITLPDGTMLTLNAQTTVRYNTIQGTRHAVVEGEAYFQVAPDTLHPFVVEAAQAQVTCLGTAFNVRNYAGETNASVVLTEGKVRVSAHESEVTMEPDSRVVMDRQTLALSKHTVRAADYTAWLNGEVKYNNQTLEEIAAELSRNYNIRLVITNDELKHERFTGYLGRASLRNILDVMCLAANMNYHIADDTIVYVYARK